MTKLEQWLKDNRLCYTLAGDTCLIFDQPPRFERAHGAAVTADTENGKTVARLLRARGWATHTTSDDQAKLNWVMSLGYGRGANRPVLRVPDVEIYGRQEIDLVVVATRVVREPRISARALATDLTASERRTIGRKAVGSAMSAIGWGPDEREAFREGVIEAPVLEGDESAPPPARLAP